MKFNEVGTAVKGLACRTGFWFKKNSPELLLGLGVVTGVAAIVAACKASTKVEAIVAPANKKIDEIKEAMNDDDLIANHQYSKKDGEKDLLKVRAKTAMQLTKLYTPAALLFSASLASYLGSYSIMKNRSASLMAAYSLMQSGYSAYRERVKNAIGEEAEDAIYRDIRKEIPTDETDGEPTEESHIDDDRDYSILFDECNPLWQRSCSLNMDTIKSVQAVANQMLRTRRYLFLYEVYELLCVNDPKYLGKKKAQAARTVGWIYDPKDPERSNIALFGVCDFDGNLTKRGHDMVCNNERSVWLDFNVDGDILTGRNGTKTFAEV